MTKHSDDKAVEEFAAAMTAKMAKSREEKGRGGWENKKVTTALVLSTALREHVEKGDPVDVANFAMMLHQRGESIVGRHPFKVELESLSARLNMLTHGADRQIRTANASVNTMRNALNDIVTKTQQSRSQTRRLSWIESRAQAALEGKAWTREVCGMPDPKNGKPRAEKLELVVREMQAEAALFVDLLVRIRNSGQVSNAFFNEINQRVGSL